ncbi:uncharacterized protein MYCFIDRAFT_202557 [Pseudocercospora fijiensis CIRAD86]|uniref:Amidohydrolase-related domain-containing protein n=1 Tax=Pseudocercospora fijiensis (strain CIRAD86) TaxID=383855 RepID=M2Z9N9_PSEFD|nr:uncharacterized protein MYCFIDRAFT_202557 [Pseudocercospora fijiensis CIRAD86]EME86580.1 hypothetical protein MYCFIDRAFT_202557 [Pseudocercospora fijiensis CIRAD86]
MLRDHAPNCKIILSHSGGDLPYIIDRPARLMVNAPPPTNAGRSTEDVLAEARTFCFDTALSSSPMRIKALMQLLRGDAEDQASVVRHRLSECAKWKLHGLA